MRELKVEETHSVAGGNPVVIGAVIGAGVGGYQAWHGGGNAGQIAFGTIMGGVSGMYGGFGMWGSAAATGAFGAFAGGGGRLANLAK